jgi:hypothetical protein
VPRPKGLPKTGGRQSGVANKRTREIADAAIKEGLTPLEYMLAVLGDETVDPERQAKVAVLKTRGCAAHHWRSMSPAPVGERERTTFLARTGFGNYLSTVSSMSLFPFNRHNLPWYSTTVDGEPSAASSGWSGGPAAGASAFASNARVVRKPFRRSSRVRPPDASASAIQRRPAASSSRRQAG